MCCCSLVSSTPAYCWCSFTSWSQRSSASASREIADKRIPVHRIVSKRREASAVSSIKVHSVVQRQVIRTDRRLPSRFRGASARQQHAARNDYLCTIQVGQ